MPLWLEKENGQGQVDQGDHQMFGAVDTLYGQRLSGWIMKDDSPNCNIEVIFYGKRIDAEIGGLRSDSSAYEERYSFTAMLPTAATPTDVVERNLQVFCVDQTSRIELKFWTPIEKAAVIERMSAVDFSNAVQFLSPSKKAALIRGLETSIWRQSEQKKNACVIAYANSVGGWFPYFYSHYASLIGADNIFLVTPNGGEFKEYSLGGIQSLSGVAFDDEARCQLMSRLSQGLLAYYNWTIICDIDEIIIAHPRSNLSFAEMLSIQESDVLMTRGFDIIQSADEPEFDFSRSVLDQRRWGVASSSLCKPHIARIPSRWSPGFHNTDFPTDFAPPSSGFITLHLKWACAKVRSEVARIVQATNYADGSTEKYSIESVTLEKHPVFFSGDVVPQVDIDSPQMRLFERRCLETRNFFGKRGLWSVPHTFDASLVDFQAQVLP
ncbi:hypothetical protein [Sandarakinorhabdus sp.]|uniref:hypothetical protein n=1 Tax=Sandarakinorhabdus sp. TaxID=1916663 RepID=UPI0033418891